MREIKFRAIKDQMSFEFAYGDGICYSPSGMPRIPDKNGMFYTCLKGTEGQYTGLKDKNGVEIYDGDIISVKPKGAKYPINWVVVFNDKLSFMIRFIDRYKRGEGSFYDEHITPNTYETFEIIGNIHQTPDLLQ